MKYNVIPSRINNVCFTTSNTNIQTTSKHNNTYTLFYIQNGNVRISTENSIQYLSAGQFIFISNQNDIIVIADQNDNFSVFKVEFSLDNPLESLVLNRIFFCNSVSEPYLKSMICEHEKKQEDYEQVILCNLTSLLIFSIRNARESDLYITQNTKKSVIHETLMTSGNNQKSIVDNCILLIRNNLENPDLNVSFLTTRLYISPAYLHKLFNKYMHTSINKYIQNLRLSRASELLKDSILPITTISEMLGFCSQCYFSTQFKKRMNVTPSEFRKQNTMSFAG